MRYNPKHAKPWNAFREHRDWFDMHNPVTGRHRKEADK